MEKAKESGKDASGCYESTRLRLRDESLKTYSSIDKCGHEAEQKLNHVMENIAKIIAVSIQQCHFTKVNTN